MKRIFLIGAFVFFTLATYAQCNQYYNVKEGTNWTTSNFNAKGKLQGKTIQKVTAYKELSNGFEATLEITSVDKKGEQTTIGSSTITCKDGVLFFDLNKMFPQEQMKGMEGFEMTVNGTNLELPSNLSTGQELKDANIVITINGPMVMNFKVDITERKVIGEETLKTPAGSFDCFKISQKILMKTIMKMEMRSTEWFAKEVGMVKSESYDKNGKLKFYTILTSHNY